MANGFFKGLGAVLLVMVIMLWSMTLTIKAIQKTPKAPTFELDNVRPANIDVTWESQLHTNAVPVQNGNVILNGGNVGIINEGPIR